MKIENAANTTPMYWTFDALKEMGEGDHYGHIKRLRTYYIQILSNVPEDKTKQLHLDLDVLNQEIDDMQEILRLSA